MTPIRLRLREATGEAHGRLEAVMGLDPAGLTRDRYGRATQVLHAVRTGWEPGLAASLPGWGGPQRKWLAADLAVLGLPPLRPAPPLLLHGAAAAWGAAYVLEGSALGGRVLLPAVEGLGLSSACGARYLAGHGPHTGRRWAAFLHRLDEAATDAAGPVIIEGACAAFAALTAFAASWMSRSAARDGASV